MSVTISAATDDDTEQILKLQYLCYQSEAELYGDYRIEPLTQTLAELRAELSEGCVLVARLGDEVIGSVRGTVDADATARISRLCVHPRMRGHGLGSRLLARIEDQLQAELAAERYRLHTGWRSESNLRLYHRSGYATVSRAQDARTKAALVTMEKEAAGAQPCTAGLTAPQPSPAAASAVRERRSHSSPVTGRTRGQKTYPIP